MNEKQYSQEERLMAALSHGSIIVSGMGIIVAVVVWLTQKDKFPYAARQAMQATIYQIVAMAAMIIAWIGWTALFMVLLVPITSAAPAGSEPPPGFWALMFSMFIPIAIMGLFWLYGIWAAIRTWQGRDFNYPLIGRLAH